MLILEITLKFLFIFQLALAAPLDYQEYLSVRKIINEENDKQNDDLPDYSLKQVILALKLIFGIGGGGFILVFILITVIIMFLLKTRRLIRSFEIQMGYLNHYFVNRIKKNDFCVHNAIEKNAVQSGQNKILKNDFYEGFNELKQLLKIKFQVSGQNDNSRYTKIRPSKIPIRIANNLKVNYSFKAPSNHKSSIPEDNTQNKCQKAFDISNLPDKRKRNQTQFFKSS
jgi:hypothetical protein